MLGTKPLTVLFLPNARRADRYLDVSGDNLNPCRFFDDLSSLGFIVKSRRLNVFPVNPLAKRGTFYAGFDVVRALCVLTLDRRVDVVVSIGESNLVIILLLAKFLRFKPRIMLREIAARGWS